MTARAPSSPENRAITRFVLAFVVVSLLASLLPLLSLGGTAGGLPFLERTRSHAIYGGFLILFAGLVFPLACTADRSHGLRPWAPLFVFAMVFASVPVVTSAWISGVPLEGAVSTLGLAALIGGLVLHLRVAFGPAAAGVTFVVAGIVFFAIPAIDLVAWNFGVRLDPDLGAWTPWSVLAAISARRTAGPPQNLVVAVAAVFVLLPIAGRVAARLRKIRAAGALGVLLVPAALMQGDGASRPALEATIHPVFGSVVRAGSRLPFDVTFSRGADGQETAEVRLRTEIHVVPTDGRAHRLCLTLREGEAACELVRGTSRATLPLGVTWPPAGTLRIGVAGGGPAVDDLRSAFGSDAVVTPFETRDLAPASGSGEAFDALVIDSGVLAAMNAPARAAMLAASTLGCTLIEIVGAVAAESRGTDAAYLRVRDASALAAMPHARLRRAINDPFDPTLRSLFARPDWQELDLFALVLFLVLYHGAFVLSFLLPLLLDSHKSRDVYLASVFFVVVACAVGARAVLRTFFLRDNQIYTQVQTIVRVGAPGSPMIARQLRCFASMSGEVRDLPLVPDRDLTVYRDPMRPPFVFAHDDSPRLAAVSLDRFNAKVVFREDIVEARAPLVCEREGPLFFLRPVAEAPDSLGLRVARVTSALLVDPDLGERQLRAVDGHFVLDPGPKSPTPVADLDAASRALLGRFGGLARSPGDSRPVPPFLVVRVSGIRRQDDVSKVFQARDLGGIVVFELAAR